MLGISVIDILYTQFKSVGRRAVVVAQRAKYFGNWYYTLILPIPSPYTMIIIIYTITYSVTVAEICIEIEYHL